MAAFDRGRPHLRCRGRATDRVVRVQAGTTPNSVGPALDTAPSPPRRMSWPIGALIPPAQACRVSWLEGEAAASSRQIRGWG